MNVTDDGVIEALLSYADKGLKSVQNNSPMVSGYSRPFGSPKRAAGSG